MKDSERVDVGSADGQGGVRIEWVGMVRCVMQVLFSSCALGRMGEEVRGACGGDVGLGSIINTRTSDCFRGGVQIRLECFHVNFRRCIMLMIFSSRPSSFLGGR